MQEIIFQDDTQLETVRTALTHAEEAIERAEQTAFWERAVQFKYIRDNRLYIAFAPGCTWDSYTQDRWETSYQRANQLIDALDISQQIEQFVVKDTTNVVLPGRESHCRPLAKLEKPEQRAEVWRRVVENVNGQGITAAKVEAEVQRYMAELEKNWIALAEWEQLSEAEQERVLTQSYHPKTFNSQNSDNIEWARWSWNPVTGCLHNCAYCYARDIAERFYPQKFQPSLVPSRLNAPFNTRQPDFSVINDPVERMGRRNVFVCSMADLFGKWVPREWIEAVLSQIESNPQWTFLLLTKFPVRMAEFNYPDNVWLGTSVDYQWAVDRAEKAFTKIKASGFSGVCWLSCEPMMEKLTFTSLDMFDWVVMGGSSRSTQTPEFRPPFEWIVHLHNQARMSGCKIYQKTNLIPGMNDDQRIREYPD